MDTQDELILNTDNDTVGHQLRGVDEDQVEDTEGHQLRGVDEDEVEDTEGHHLR